MTEFVEFVSHGNVMVMLLFIAFVCLVLGLGVPTTANYVLVATLMAPVVVELGAQSGLIIPLIAVHLFVFYYGIMGDITPPVGLATLRGGRHLGRGRDPDRHPGQHLCAAHGDPAVHLDLQSATAADRCALHSRARQRGAGMHAGHTRLRGRDNGVVPGQDAWLGTQRFLALAVVLLFRPDYFMDRLTPEYTDVPAAKLYEVARSAPDRVVMVIEGQTLEERRQAQDGGTDPRAGHRRPQAAAGRRPHRRHARRQGADRAGQVRHAGRQVRFRAGLGRGHRQGADRSAHAGTGSICPRCCWSVWCGGRKGVGWCRRHRGSFRRKQSA